MKCRFRKKTLAAAVIIAIIILAVTLGAYLVHLSRCINFEIRNTSVQSIENIQVMYTDKKIEIPILESNGKKEFSIATKDYYALVKWNCGDIEYHDLAYFNAPYARVGTVHFEINCGGYLSVSFEIPSNVDIGTLD